VKVSELIADSRNANKGTGRGREMLADSLRRYGVGRSILIDKNGRIIAGNKTAEQATTLGLDEVIVVQTDGKKLVAVQRTDLDLECDAGAKELAIADNRVAEASLEWDLDVLRELSAEIDLSDLWNPEELDALIGIGDLPKELLTDEDAVPETPAEPVTQTGDIYLLGQHRLMCGDSTGVADVERLLDGAKVDLVYTDPPYGINIVRSDGKIGSGGKFGGKIGSGKMVPANTYAPIIGDDSTETAIEVYRLCAALDVPAMIFWGGNYYADHTFRHPI
jgi:16S rRNA G966 N2-methylase RsmD